MMYRPSFNILVPIIPDYLYRIEHPAHNCSLKFNKMTSSDRECHLIFRENATIPFFHRHQTVKEAASVEHDLVQENGRIGLLFASKSFVQLFTNPLVGLLTARFGYTPPLLFGFVVMFGSTCGFAFAHTYTTLFLCRALQGLGSAFTAVAGFGFLASQYHNDEERGIVISHVTSGVAIGAALGPFLGGVLYYNYGKTTMFLLLAFIALIDGLLRLSMMCGSNSMSEGKSVEYGGGKTNVSIPTLLCDPYIWLMMGCILLSLSSGAILETILPIHMMIEWMSPSWLQGAVFLPFAIAMFLSQNIFGRLSFRMGRWLCSLLGMQVIAVGFISITQAQVVSILIISVSLVGIGIGMISSSMVAGLIQIVDVRYASGFGNIFSLFDMALCLCFILGPIISGYAHRLIGFDWLLYLVAALNIMYAPLLLLIRKVPTKIEQTSNEQQEKYGEDADADCF
ncbi:unnamed protein product [Adineta ricciae]|uniref:Major facilitator superfamily (MFS) profile domain-containing protein n=1 Tax=Adineta ricciae TaxID=249248 RepID=A0A816BA28_ADIRI|nr:unnamed protein product [Adineta ricciae]